ncbi:MAG: enolase C-terminal domain-like protein [Enterocloster sp.]
MTLPEAVAFGRAVEPYRPMILEDPVPPDNVDTMAEVASKVGVPIATGERFIDLREFEVLMARHACRVCPPGCMCSRRYHYQQEDLRAGRGS